MTFFYLWAYQSKSTLSDGKHQQNATVVTSILNADTDNAITQHGDPMAVCNTSLQYYKYQIAEMFCSVCLCIIINIIFITN